ncbi:MAG: phospholipase [Gammaproteobacteria bacterium]|nr:MAG: phospholipase [Gammaproteobacteria bacterium]
MRTLLSLAMLALASQANAIERIDQCLLDTLKAADAQTTVETVRMQCNAQLERSLTETAVPAEPLMRNEQRPDRAALSRSKPGYTRYALLPYKPIYILPFSYNANPNEDPFLTGGPSNESLDHTEIKFQLSMQVPLALELFGDNGDLILGYTQASWWQAYNNDISSPFRETNYEPEIFLSFHNDWEVLGFRNTQNQFGFNHQSNGRGGDLSRSWNRLFANFIFEKENWLVSVKPWWRIPEDDKDYIGDPSGDDNPDIEKYMGYGEFLTVYREGNHTVSMLLRNNLRSDNKGAVQLDWSFPVSKRLRGQVQYFNGYGESLIDYNASTERISFGFQFTDWLF